MESDHLIERNTLLKKRIIALVLICLAILFDYSCVYGLKDKLLSLLIRKYDLPKIKALTYKSELYIFFLIMAGIGGLFSDLLLSRILLVILCYICSFFGIVGLILLELNSNQIPSVPVLCKFKNDTYPPKCMVFLYLINILIGCGTGFIRVMLFVIGTDQVRSCGPRSVSICIYAIYAVSQMASMFVDIQSVIESARKPLHTFTYFLIGIVGCLILSFALFIAGRLLAEFRRQNGFLREYFEATKELFRSFRRGESIKNLFYSTKFRLRLENRDMDDSLEAIKRLAFFAVTWWLLIPCCSVLSQIDINNSQPRFFMQPFRNYKFNFDLVNSTTVVVSVIIFIYFSLKYLNPGEVFSYKRRFIVGTSLSIIAGYYFGIIETIRLHHWDKNDTVSISNTLNQTEVANLSVLFLLPSYILAAISEVFIFVTGLEYAYLSIPPSLQCSAVGFVWASWGMGSIIASSFFNRFGGVSSLNEFRNRDRLDICYYSLTSFSVLLFLVMMLITTKILPNVFHPCYIGLEERLLGAHIDEPEEDSEEEEYIYVRNPRLNSRISMPS